MRTLTLTLLTCWITFTASAMEVVPMANQGQLGARLSQVQYPENFEKALTSGLTTRLFVRLQLMNGSTVLREAIYEASIKYDLWDEDFLLEQSLVEEDKIKVKSKEKLIMQLRNIRLPGVFGTPSASGESLRIRADLLLNPVQKEKLKKIRQWVAANSVVNPMSPGSGRGATTSGARGSSMFNTIFEQFTKGEEVAGIWKTSAESKSFQWEEVKNAQ